MSQEWEENQPIEIWIADDGSQDETLAIARNYANNPFTFRILSSSKNRGERQNVNEAFRQLASCGFSWLLLLHSDDVAKPAWLKTMIRRASDCASDVGSICSSWDNWYPDGRVIAGEDDEQRDVEQIPGTTEAARSTLRRGCWWHISGCAIRAETFLDVGDFDARFPQLGDWDWLIRCLQRGWAVEYIPRTLIKYRQHSASVSAGSFSASRDILEALQVATKYARTMTRWELMEFHLRREKFVGLRLGRALFKRDYRRALELIRLVPEIASNAVRCLVAEAF
jgi:glycosyltransferase involved in cell wall biosynthesis